MSDLVTVPTAEAETGGIGNPIPAGRPTVPRIGDAAMGSGSRTSATGAFAGPPAPVVLRVARARMLSVVMTATTGAAVGLMASVLFDHLSAAFAAPPPPLPATDRPISPHWRDTSVPDAASVLAERELPFETMAPTF